jgi:hypothetical protein
MHPRLEWKEKRELMIVRVSTRKKKERMRQDIKKESNKKYLEWNDH